MVVSGKQECGESTEKAIFIECCCGTHAIKIKRYDDEDEYWISICSDNFYNKQKQSFFTRLLNKLKFIWSIIRGKEYLLEEFVLVEKDINQLITSLEEIKNNK